MMLEIKMQSYAFFLKMNLSHSSNIFTRATFITI